jgi:hypothetical protein
MPELRLKEEIQEPLTHKDIKALSGSYKALLHEYPFPTIQGSGYEAYLRYLKRERFNIGPYTDITVFEAANRIATDLALFAGVEMLFKKKMIPLDSTVKLRLGTIQEKDKGDFSVIQGRKESQGEVFDVAPSFFRVNWIRPCGSGKGKRRLGLSSLTRTR